MLEDVLSRTAGKGEFQLLVMDVDLAVSISPLGVVHTLGAFETYALIYNADPQSHITPVVVAKARWSLVACAALAAAAGSRDGGRRRW